MQENASMIYFRISKFHGGACPPKPPEGVDLKCLPRTYPAVILNYPLVTKIAETRHLHCYHQSRYHQFAFHLHNRLGVRLHSSLCSWGMMGRHVSREVKGS